MSQVWFRGKKRTHILAENDVQTEYHGQHRICGKEKHVTFNTYFFYYSFEFVMDFVIQSLQD